jgi:O-antigen/teichoic acid export membrane protein
VPYLNNFIGAEFGILLILAVVSREISLSFNKALVGQDRVPHAKLIELVGIICWIVSSVLLLRQGLGPVSLVYGLFVKHVVVGSASLFFTGLLFAVPKIQHVRSIFHFGKYTIITYTSGYVYNWADTILIGAIMGPSAVSVYEIAWRVSSVFMVVASSLGTTLYPKVSGYHKSGNYSAISGVVENSLVAGVFFIIPGIVGAHLIGDSLLDVFYGAEYITGAVVLTILIAEKVVNSTNSILKFTLNGMDRPELSALAKITSLFVNILLNALLISVFGIIGAAIATFTASFVDTVLHHHYLSKLVDYEVDPSSVLWLIFSSLVMGIFVYLVDQSIVINTVMAVLAIVFISGLIYTGISFVPRRVRRSFSDLRNY